MKILTTNFAGKEAIYFDFIKLVHFHGDPCNQTQDVMFSVSIHEHPLKISNFFKDVARFMKSKKVRDSHFKEREHFQFVLSNKEYDNFPVKWFTLELDNGVRIDHDFAFSTTLIKKNGFMVPFGGFNFSKWESFARHREINMKRNAYKFIANEVFKDYFKK